MEKKKESIVYDYRKPVFLANLYPQSNYDMEIDEGWSSGMRRYATIDVSALSKNQIESVLERIIKEAEDFSVCKSVQVSGFNKSRKRYLAVSGESHLRYQVDIRDLMLEQLYIITENLPVKYLDSYVEPPRQDKNKK
ncbi:MAG: hypothetical protein NTV63_00745 [Candidatus Woesearchaeota archaeon]|nr:hypothetical protein [Candidatus Woesearchaeota archaeon]